MKVLQYICNVDSRCKKSWSTSKAICVPKKGAVIMDLKVKNFGNVNCCIMYMFLHHSARYIHTHIIGHYNPSFRIIDLVYHISYVVCVNFIHKWRHLHFKVDSE